MPKFVLKLAIALLCLPQFAFAKDPVPVERSESLIELQLTRLIEREGEIFERSSSAISASDIERIKDDIQLVVDGYDNLIGRSPNFAPTYVAYGLLLNRIGEKETSNNIFLKANDLDPRIPVVKNQLGNYLAEAAAYVEALAYYISAADLDPGEPLYHYQLSTLLISFRSHFIEDELFSSEEIDQKIQDELSKAKILDPSKIAYAYAYAESFYEVESPDWTAALQAWQELEARLDDEFEIQTTYAHQARVHIHLGNISQARSLIYRITHKALHGHVDELNKLVEESRK